MPTPPRIKQYRRYLWQLIQLASTYPEAEALLLQELSETDAQSDQIIRALDYVKARSNTRK